MAAGRIAVDKIYDANGVFAIRDISPRAPTHALVIPQKHIPKLSDLTTADGDLLGAMFQAANQVARKEGLAGEGIAARSTWAMMAAKQSFTFTCTSSAAGNSERRGSLNIRATRLLPASSLFPQSCSWFRPALGRPAQGGSAAVETSTVVTSATTATRTPTSSATAARPATPASATPSSATPAVAATPMSQQQLDRMALSSTDLPPGFSVTASGPGGQELGQDVLASFQEEFQQKDVTSGAGLQQTIVIINLVGQYRDPASAANGVKALSAQSLNQLLNSVNLNAEPAALPGIGEDTQGFHFTGDTNGVGVGG